MLRLRNGYGRSNLNSPEVAEPERSGLDEEELGALGHLDEV